MEPGSCRFDLGIYRTVSRSRSICRLNLGNRSPVATRTLQTELPHEARQRTSELYFAFAGS